MRTTCLVTGLVLAIGSTACSTIEPMGGPIQKTDWKELRGPQDNANETARWYLNEILAEMMKPGSGATTTQQIAILSAYSIRSTLIHEFIPRDASWARVQRAYRYAQDKNWDHVIHALGTDSGAPPDIANPMGVRTTPTSWPEYAPTPPIDVTKSIDQIFDMIKTNTTPSSSAYSTVQHNAIVAEYTGCTPSATASAASAWVGLWEALEVSRHPPSNASGTTTEPCAAAIICEVCPD